MKKLISLMAILPLLTTTLNNSYAVAAEAVQELDIDQREIRFPKFIDIESDRPILGEKEEEENLRIFRNLSKKRKEAISPPKEWKVD